MKTLPARGRAFTLIEVLVVIAIVALLVGILLPALGAARDRSRQLVCGTRLHQLGVALGLYVDDFDRALPQVLIDTDGDGVAEVVGALFGGKKGTLPAFGIDQYGAERRPLNAYLVDGDVPRDADDQPFEIEAFSSPSDAGGDIPGLGPGGASARVESMYELLGSSYTLNDHVPDGEAFFDTHETLVPNRGGRLPRVDEPTRLIMAGSYPMYNFDGGDRDHRWYTPPAVTANAVMVDGHAETGLVMGVDVRGLPEAEGVSWTFLPQAGWPRP